MQTARGGNGVLDDTRRRHRRRHRHRTGARAGPAPRTGTRTAPPAPRRRARSCHRATDRPTRRPSTSLAIPDYDELSASQVVERLEGLDAGVARGDPPLRGGAPRPQHDPGQDRAAHLSHVVESARRRHERRRPAHRRARPPRCAPSSSAMKGGELWLQRDAWPEPLSTTRTPRCSTRDDASVVVGTIDDVVVGFGVVVVETLRSGAHLGVDHRPVRGARGAVGRGRGVRSPTPARRAAPSADASASTPSRCPATATPRTSSRRNGFTARALTMHRDLRP